MIELTERDKRMLLRGMSMARGILKNTHCSHHDIVRDYQEILADAWAFAVTADSTIAEQREFMEIVDQLNEAIASKHPDWTTRDGRKVRRQ